MAAPTDLKRVISPSRAAPLCRAAAELEEIAEHRLLADHAGGERLEDVPGLPEGTGSRVHEDARAAHHLVVGLAHVRLVGADAVDVGARHEPRAVDQGLGRDGGGRNDVGPARGRLQVVDDADLEASRLQRRGERAGAIGAAVPDGDFTDRAYGGMRADEVGHQRAGADHQVARGVGA